MNLEVFLSTFFYVWQIISKFPGLVEFYSNFPVLNTSSENEDQGEDDTNSMVLASDSPDTYITTSDDENQGKKSIKSVDILEQYYVVAYDRKWYIGRILNILNDNLDTYEWPRYYDIQEVKEPFVFYGPIILFTGPFTIKRHDHLTIEKNLKKYIKPGRTSTSKYIV